MTFRSRMSVADDNVQFVSTLTSTGPDGGPLNDFEHSQRASMTPWWRTRPGALMAATALCAIVMIVAAGCNLAGIGRMTNHEDAALNSLGKAIRDISHLTPPTTERPTTASTGATPPTPSCPADQVNDHDKFDCHPEDNATETACIARGCCWLGSTPQREPSYEDPTPVNVPRCYFPTEGFVAYRTDSVVKRSDGLELVLSRQFPSGLPRDENRLLVRAINYDYHTARITIESTAHRRWIPPLPPVADKSTERDVGFQIKLEGKLNSTLAVYRRKAADQLEDKPLFSASLATLIFSDQFLQLSTPLPSSKVYGLGEMKGPLLHMVNWTRRVLFNKDQPPRNNRALYGAHALMVNLDDQNQASGVFVKNSNPMDVILQPQPAATFRTIGGIFDFFVFIGPSPGDVFSQYQRLVGMPAMVPYWSLGFHLCRYGYWSLNKTIEAYERNVQAKVPLEVQWNDIDYMERFNMFTYDKEAFKGLPEFVQRVHNDNRKYMMIFDPAMSGSEPDGTYPPYDEGLKMDIFIKNVTGHIVAYKVWNEQTSIFPDFSHPRIDDFWTSMFKGFHEQIDFDGAWIDMNEPSNQRNGTKLTDTCPDTRLDRPPVVIGGEALYTYTACMSDRFYLGSHYDLHNLYPHLEARATYRALAAVRPGKRPFIISRASSPGQGLWSGHWTGDIDSSWGDLKQSIPDIINFAMYGMPMLGADICGFQYNTTQELCARWQAVGAFYPFTRNHNDKDQNEQDPAALGGDVLNATITTLQKKYLFAPYLYTLLYRAHVYGETVVRATMFNFASDPKTHSLDEQFMWGDALLIAPALQPGQTEVRPYLPAGAWYHYNDNGRPFLQLAGAEVPLAAPINDIQLLLRGGHIIPGQITSEDNLSGNRANGFVLFVALDESHSAHGDLFWDDGESIDTVERGLYSYVQFEASATSILTRPVQTAYRAEPMKLTSIKVSGVGQAPSRLFVNGEELTPAKKYLDYDAKSLLLQISAIDIDLLERSNVITFS